MTQPARQMTRSNYASIARLPTRQACAFLSILAVLAGCLGGPASAGAAVEIPSVADGLTGPGSGIGVGSGNGAASMRNDEALLPVIPAWIILPDETGSLRGVLHPPTLVEPAHGRIEFDSPASVGQLVTFFQVHFERAGFHIRLATEPITPVRGTPALGVRAGLAADDEKTGRTLDIVIHEIAGQRLVRMRYRGS